MMMRKIWLLLTVSGFFLVQAAGAASDEDATKKTNVSGWWLVTTTCSEGSRCTQLYWNFLEISNLLQIKIADNYDQQPGSGWVNLPNVDIRLGNDGNFPPGTLFISDDATATTMDGTIIFPRNTGLPNATWTAVFSSNTRPR